MTTRESSLRTQMIFREANEAIDRNRLFEETELLGFLCECSDVSCERDIELTPDEYAAVRHHSSRFVIAAGHEDGTERVVDEFDRYAIVEKKP